MFVSIALATYNGAVYLQEQLDSFLRQTRLPDELVVCDDGSTDGTVQILENFKKIAPFAVTIYKNEKRLGYSKNFEKALTLCDGDLILISDQDDVWFENKIFVIEDISLIYPDSMVFLNDQEITDKALNSANSTTYSRTLKIGYEVGWVSAGCCTAIRKLFLRYLCPFPDQIMPYDTWIHNIAGLLGVRFIINDVLQYYRRHSDNVSESLILKYKNINRFVPIKEYCFTDVTNGWQKEIESANYIYEHLLSVKDKGSDGAIG